MQKNLFSDNFTTKTNPSGLTISKATKKTLTKNQQEFNKITLRIEKLQAEISKKQDKLDLAMKMLGKDLHPLKVMLVAERKENVRILWEHFNTKKLSQRDQQALKEIVREQLQEIFSELTEEPDDILKKIFKGLEGQEYDKFLNQEKEEALKEIKDALKKMKVDIEGINDLNDLESLEKKLFEHSAKIGEAYFENMHKKRNVKKEKAKSAKQIEAEKIQAATEELKKKNIGTIYKQLAKLFHPDLEQDEERKVEKVLLMQELTACYEAKNLHALLSLELKWIHKESDHLESLTEEKLAVYLQILKEQVNDLTYQKHQLVYQPQYGVLVEHFGPQIQQSPIETISYNIAETKNLIESLKEGIGLFKSGAALRHVKAMIKEWRENQQEEEMDDEALFQLLFGK